MWAEIKWTPRFWFTFWFFLLQGLRLSLWLAPVFPHLGPSRYGWHGTGLSKGPPFLLLVTRTGSSGRSKCNKGNAWQEGSGPAVFPWLPEATVQDKEAWQNLNGWRKRMFWDEDGPHWLHQWAWLLGLQHPSQLMTSVGMSQPVTPSWPCMTPDPQESGSMLEWH